jgi:hypothetical protein
MPGTFFDDMQNTVFETVKEVFGPEVSWTSIDQLASYTGKILFKNPTEELQTAGVFYDPQTWMMEYKEGDFPGLKERVDARGTPEIVVIDGANFVVKSIDTVFDGKTFRAHLQPKQQ